MKSPPPIAEVEPKPTFPAASLKEPTTAPQMVGRSVPLDFLRGVAALTILLHHNIVPWESAGLFRFPAHILINSGWLAVDLFFVLSGFLVGGLLFKEIRRNGKCDVKRFLIRRGLKIWPAYYFLLVFDTFWSRFSPFTKGHPPFKQTLPNWVHLQNYFGTNSNLGPTWSLAVEEHFYLGLPLLLLLFLKFEKTPRERIRIFPYALLLILIGCCFWRFQTPQTNPLASYWGADEPFKFFARMARTHLRIDSLMWGVGLAYLFHFLPQKWNKLARYSPLLLVASCVLLFPVVKVDRHSHFTVTAGFTLAYLAFSALLLACVGRQDSTTPFREKLWSWKPIRWVSAAGAFSYGIYLWHIGTSRQIGKWFWDSSQDVSDRPAILGHAAPTWAGWNPTLHWFLATATYMAAAVVVGVLTTRAIEAPFLRWRDKLFPPKDGRTIGATGVVAAPDFTHAETIPATPQHHDSR